MNGLDTGVAGKNLNPVCVSVVGGVNFVEQALKLPGGNRFLVSIKARPVGGAAEKSQPLAGGSRGKRQEAESDNRSDESFQDWNRKAAGLFSPLNPLTRRGIFLINHPVLNLNPKTKQYYE